MLNKQLKLLVGRPSSHEIPQGDGTTGFVGAPADFVMLLEIQKFQIKQRWKRKADVGFDSKTVTNKVVCVPGGLTRFSLCFFGL